MINQPQSEPRWRVLRHNGRFGVLDTEQNRFAPFTEDQQDIADWLNGQPLDMAVRHFNQFISYPYKP